MVLHVCLGLSYKFGLWLGGDQVSITDIGTNEDVFLLEVVLNEVQRVL